MNSQEYQKDLQLFRLYPKELRQPTQYAEFKSQNVWTEQNWFVTLSSSDFKINEVQHTSRWSATMLEKIKKLIWYDLLVAYKIL